MLTDDQLTSIALQVAKVSIDPQGFSKDTYEEMVEEETLNIAHVLRLLFVQFYLVDKDKVHGEYLLARADDRTSGEVPIVKAYHNGEMDILERIFPEIAKEVEG